MSSFSNKSLINAGIQRGDANGSIHEGLGVLTSEFLMVLCCV